MLFTNSYFYFQILAVMENEIVVESIPEAAEGDDISSAQPLPGEEQPSMAHLHRHPIWLPMTGLRLEFLQVEAKSSLLGQMVGLTQCLWVSITRSSIPMGTGLARDIKYLCLPIHM